MQRPNLTMQLTKALELVVKAQQQATEPDHALAFASTQHQCREAQLAEALAIEVVARETAENVAAAANTEQITLNAKLAVSNSQQARLFAEVEEVRKALAAEVASREVAEQDAATAANSAVQTDVQKVAAEEATRSLQKKQQGREALEKLREEKAAAATASLMAQLVAANKALEAEVAACQSADRTAATANKSLKMEIAAMKHAEENSANLSAAHTTDQSQIQIRQATENKLNQLEQTQVELQRITEKAQAEVGAATQLAQHEAKARGAAEQAAAEARKDANEQAALAAAARKASRHDDGLLAQLKAQRAEASRLYDKLETQRVEANRRTLQMSARPAAAELQAGGRTSNSERLADKRHKPGGRRYKCVTASRRRQRRRWQVQLKVYCECSSTQPICAGCLPQMITQLRCDGSEECSPWLPQTCGMQLSRGNINNHFCFEDNAIKLIRVYDCVPTCTSWIFSLSLSSVDIKFLDEFVQLND